MLLHICECSCIREQGRKQDLTGGVGALSFWHQISLQLGKRGANILVKTGAIIFFFYGDLGLGGAKSQRPPPCIRPLWEYLIQLHSANL